MDINPLSNILGIRLINRIGTISDSDTAILVSFWLRGPKQCVHHPRFGTWGRQASEEEVYQVRLELDRYISENNVLPSALQHYVNLRSS